MNRRRTYPVYRYKFAAVLVGYQLLAKIPVQAVILEICANFFVTRLKHRLQRQCRMRLPYSIRALYPQRPRITPRQHCMRLLQQLYKCFVRIKCIPLHLARLYQICIHCRVILRVYRKIISVKFLLIHLQISLPISKKLQYIFRLLVFPQRYRVQA